MGEFPGSPVARTWHFHCRGPGSIPDWGAKIPQEAQQKKKKKKLFKFVLEESEAIEQHLSRWFEGSQHSEGHCVGIM